MRSVLLRNSLYHPALLGIFILPPVTLWDSHFTACWMEKGCFQVSNAATAIENQTIGAGMTTNLLQMITGYLNLFFILLFLYNEFKCGYIPAIPTC